VAGFWTALGARLVALLWLLVGFVWGALCALCGGVDQGCRLLAQVRLAWHDSGTYDKEVSLPRPFPPRAPCFPSRDFARTFPPSPTHSRRLSLARACSPHRHVSGVRLCALCTARTAFIARGGERSPNAAALERLSRAQHGH
jgi:hypothetical protein